MTEAAIALRGPSVAMINSAVHSFTEQSRAFFLQQTGDPVVSRELAWQALENLRQQRASALAYFDCFWIRHGDACARSVPCVVAL